MINYSNDQFAFSWETWPMSVKDEKRMTTTEMRLVRWAMGVSLLEHRRNEEILEVWYGNNRDEDGAMGNGSKPDRTPEK